VLAATSLVALLVLTPARAQYYDWREDFYGDPRGPPGFYYPERSQPRAEAPNSATLSLADVRQRVAQRGMHLIATPRRKGRIYLAEAEDAHGIRHRLVFDAFEGRLIENTVLGPKSPVSNHAVVPDQRSQADDVDQTKGKAQEKSAKPE